MGKTTTSAECFPRRSGLWESADTATARLLAAFLPSVPKIARMDDPRRHAANEPATGRQDLSAEARGLFAAGWYATREEGRLVHPLDRTEQIVSPQTWRALRELASSAPMTAMLQP